MMNLRVSYPLRNGSSLVIDKISFTGIVICFCFVFSFWLLKEKEKEKYSRRVEGFVRVKEITRDRHVTDSPQRILRRIKREITFFYFISLPLL